MNNIEISQSINKCLTTFYQKRTRLLRAINLQVVLEQSNPFLLRVTYGESAPKIVEQLVSIYLGARDEKIFGESFFELAQLLSKDTLSPNQFGYQHLFTQEFWQEITGDPDFYLKIIRLANDPAIAKHRYEYVSELAAAHNRCVREFVAKFCDDEGRLDWGKISKPKNDSIAKEEPLSQRTFRCYYTRYYGELRDYLETTTFSARNRKEALLFAIADLKPLFADTEAERLKKAKHFVDEKLGDTTWSIEEFLTAKVEIWHSDFLYVITDIDEVKSRQRSK